MWEWLLPFDRLSKPRFWWNKITGWRPIYHKRGKHILLAGIVAFAIAWYVIDASPHVLSTIALVTGWCSGFYAGWGDMLDQWREVDDLRFELTRPEEYDQDKPWHKDEPQDAAWLIWAKAEHADVSDAETLRFLENTVLWRKSLRWPPARRFEYSRKMIAARLGRPVSD